MTPEWLAALRLWVLWVAALAALGALAINFQHWP